MPNDTQSSGKINDNESNNLKGRHCSGKESTTSCSATSDSSGLRRSTREASLKRKIIPSPPCTRKSGRLDKQTPTSSTVNRKSERIEKKGMPSPLRRSERCKKLSSSSSSGSKISDRSLSSTDTEQKKGKKERSVKMLTLETKVGRREREDVESAPVKKKRMDARAYRALFKTQPKKVVAAAPHDRNRLDKSSQGGSYHRGVEVYEADDCSERREEKLREGSVGRAFDRALVIKDSSVHKFSKEIVEDNTRVEFCHPTQRHISADESCDSLDGHGHGMEVSKNAEAQSSYDAMEKDMSDGPQTAKVDCSTKETVQTSDLIDPMVKKKTLDRDSERCQEVMPLNGKRKSGDMDSDASAKIASNDICTSIADAVTSSSPGFESNNLVETCGSSCKRQRVDDDSAKNQFYSCNMKLNHESSDTKDRGRLGATATVGYTGKSSNFLQQKESLVDLRSETEQNTCLVCQLDGKLLCCDGRGCGKTYHLSCLDPSLEDVPLGVWHCLACIRKKMELGVHSVSEGLESIWDEREVEVLDGDSLLKQKQFFVKYKGLAHAHNRWLPQSQVLHEAPWLIVKFGQKTQVMRWTTEWTLPRRLLRKRLLPSLRQCDKYYEGPAADYPDGRYEWLVKWRGLSYEHATWELENAPFLISPEGQGLIKDYENRRKKAKLTSGGDKLPERKKGSLHELSPLRPGDTPGFDNTHLDYVNKLCEFWHKAKNAVVIDDQEHVVKAITFILSLQPDVHRPFLIISPFLSLNSWDHEFFHLAPSLDVVVYSGNKDTRKSIRTLEFCEEGSCPLFQVLISSPEVIIMDVNILKCIQWEAIIVDESQRSTISCFEHIKMLHTDRRLLLVNGQLKDSKDEYLKLLSLLDFQCDLYNGDALITSSSDNIGKLRERFSSYIAYERKLDSSRFLEYWVPAPLSNVQLEQYCAILLSNSIALRSFSKHDSVGVLRNILISARKCCDHPYLVDPSLRTLLTKGLQEVGYLDVEIKASGKLQVLDMMLRELKKQGLKVLILFQTISGSGRDSLGDILDDFLSQRFGLDSYERVEMGVIPSKKGAALNRFNKKEWGRFIFLLEFHACLPSIKLSSVDAVIIFDSDWTPINNLKALRRITVDPQLGQIKVFRLYSSFTVEENVLILAKQNKVIDSLENISRSTSNMLLMMGVSHLFDSLDRFHGDDSAGSTANKVSEKSLLNIVQEFLSVLKNREHTDSSNSSMILKVQQAGGTYSTSFPLPGELTAPLSGELQAHLFWTKLLEEKQYQWKYADGSSQRIRKRAQHELPKRPEVENDAVVKKLKKVLNNNVDPCFLIPGREGEERSIISGDKDGVDIVTESLPRSIALVKDNLHAHHAATAPESPNSISEFLEGNMVELEERKNLCDTEKSRHRLLKLQIEKLCPILQLSEDIKRMVEKFLEYVMNNHYVNVNEEPARMLQAFQISLCWTAASFLNHKVDHKESLSRAKQHLSFDCSRAQVNYVNSLLQCLKNLFLYRTGSFKIAESPNISKLPSKCVTNEHSRARLPQSTLNVQKEKGQVEALSMHQECTDKQILHQPGLTLEFQLAQKDISKSISEIQKKCAKHLKKLIQKQQEEKEEIKRTAKEEKAQLEKKQRMESAIIHNCFQSNASMRIDKLKMLDNEYSRRIELLECQVEKRLKHLEERQLIARKNLIDWEAHWVEKVKSWAQVELLNKISSNEPGGGMKCLKTGEQVRACDIPGNGALLSDHILEEHSSDITLDSLPSKGLGCYGTQETVPEKAVETSALLPRLHTGSGDLSTTASESLAATVIENSNKAVRSGDDQVQVDPVNPYSKEPNPGESSPSKPDMEVLIGLPETVNSSVGAVDFSPLNLSSSEEHRATSEMSCGEFPLHVPEIAVLSKSQQNGISMNQPSKEHTTEGSSVPGEGVISGVLGTVNTTDDLDNPFSVSLSEGGQTPDGAKSSMPDAEARLGICQTAPGIVVEVNETNNQNSKAYAVVADDFTIVDQQDVVSGTSCQNSQALELSLVESHSLEPLTIVAQGGPLSSSQALQDECTPSPASTRLAIGDEPAKEMRNSLQQAEPSVSHHDDTVPSNQLNGAAPRIEPVTQIHLLSSADSGSGDEPTNEMWNILQQVEPSVSHHDDAVSSNQLNDAAPRIEEPVMQIQLLSCADSHSGDEPANEMRNSLQQVEPSVAHHDDAVPSNQLNDAVPRIERVMQIQLLSSADSRAGDELANEMRNSFQQVEPSVSHHDNAVPSNQLNDEAPRIEPMMQIQPLSSADSPSGNNESYLPSAGGVEHRLSIEGHTSNQIAQTSTELVDNIVEISDQAVLQRATSCTLHLSVAAPISGLGARFQGTMTIPSTSEITNHPMQTSPPVAYCLPMLSYPDPLQIESERIRKETEQTIKVHEDTKLQLKTDCEKEIDEAVSQIRRKYETKIQEMEAEFLLKKKEMDANQNSVLMNKILAEAFRYKFMDPRLHGSSGIQQDMNPNFMQQLVQLSTQQNARGSTLIAGQSSSDLSAASLQTTSAPAANLQTIPLTGGHRITRPPAQTFHPPSAVFSSIPTRPLNIGSVFPPTGNLQIGSEIRAPAPHMQPFRPSTTTCAACLPSLPCVLPSQQVPSQQAPSYPNMVSPALPHLPPRAALPTYQTDPHNWVQRSEIAGVLPALPNSSLSALDLFMDVDRLPGPNLPNLALPPDSRSDFNSRNLTAFSTSSTRVNAVRTGGALDVVCLSDDD